MTELKVNHITHELSRQRDEIVLVHEVISSTILTLYLINVDVEQFRMLEIRISFNMCDFRNFDIQFVINLMNSLSLSRIRYFFEDVLNVA